MAEASSSPFATASGAPTVREVDERPVEDGVLHLIVMGANIFSMHPLPEAGAVSIGRDDDDDVRIDEPNASRHHARLHVGTVLEIEDLGSTNGTRLRGNLLQPGQRATVLPGEAISIGWATLMIQRRRPTVRVRRIPTHAYFEGRLEEECDKAASSGRVFAVLRLHVAPGTSPEAVGEIVSPHVRPGDVFASYGPDEYEMILFEHDAKRVDDFGARIVGRLGAGGVGARTGVAFFPADARSADGLIARACERVQGRNVSGAPTADDIDIRFGPEMRRVHLLAKRAAVSNINVLVVGETGVGKEVLAEIIHGLSPRAQKPFVRINCAALSPTLFEAELFGHDRGAFTDAREAKPGLLETAEGGTVLLDEIGELPLPLQAKLLRVIETREVMRVGAIKPRTIDVRFLAATNRVLEDEVARGAFRQDLYYRLNGISLLIPPLRSRVDEIEPLAQSFVENAAKRSERPAPILSPAAMKLLLSYAWPGNIRELRNTIERALLLSTGDSITPEDLPLEKMRGTPVSMERVPETAPRVAHTFAAAALDEESRLDYERIVESLSLCSGNQTRAAKLLGMSRRTFCARLKAYNIPRPRTTTPDRSF
jgi:two-component system, NtrC family, response regulator AtoC